MGVISRFPGGGQDKSKGLTATAEDIAFGKTALVNGNVLVGTLLTVKNASIDFAATTGDNTLHLRNQPGGYDCTIHWGDGTSTLAPINGGNVIHNYSVGGIYNIIIMGKSFAGFYVNGKVGKEKYVAVHSMGRWEVDTAKNLDGCFRGCTGLTALPPDLFRYNTAATDFSFCFYGCTGLTTLPSGLFQYNTAVTSFSGCFYGCTGLTTLPTGLFQYNTAVTSFISCFRVCTNLTTLPSGLFRYNTAATDFSFCFYGCTGLTTLPSGLFRYNTAATSFSSCFDGCTGLTTLPPDLFRYNTAATGFSYCFYGCTGLTTLPPDLFQYNTAVTSFSSCFYGCTRLTLRIDIFGTDYANRFKGKDISFSSCFNRASFFGVQGTAPELWSFTGLTATRVACFRGAGNSTTSLSNYNSIPAEWK